MAPTRRNMQRGYAVIVLGVNVRARGEQNLNLINISPANRIDQFISEANLRIEIQQQTGQHQNPLHVDNLS
jgi:hypothetical protein